MRKLEAHTPLREGNLHQIMMRCRVCLGVTINKIEKKPDEIDPDGNVTYDDRKHFMESAFGQFFPATYIMCKHCRVGTISDLIQVLPSKEDDAVPNVADVPKEDEPGTAADLTDDAPGPSTDK